MQNLEYIRETYKKWDQIWILARAGHVSVLKSRPGPRPAESLLCSMLLRRLIVLAKSLETAESLTNLMDYTNALDNTEFQFYSVADSSMQAVACANDKH